MDPSQRRGRTCPADLVLLSTRGPHLCPRHDLAAEVLYAAHPGDVTHVMCEGRWLLKGAELQTLDEEKIRAEVSSRARRMVSGPMASMRSYDS